MKESMKADIKKGDIWLLIIALITVVVMVWLYDSNERGDCVHVTTEGMEETYSLLENRSIILKGNNGALNELVIQNGQVYMKRADCPDQVCVHHDPISENGEMIICLPNKVFVEIESSIENEIDN